MREAALKNSKYLEKIEFCFKFRKGNADICMGHTDSHRKEVRDILKEINKKMG